VRLLRAAVLRLAVIGVGVVATATGGVAGADVGDDVRCRGRLPRAVRGAVLAEPRWETLPPGPVDERVLPSVIWTGREVVVWGGEEGSEGPRQSTGAAYDPARRRWRRIADAPIDARSHHVAVWTGVEMIVAAGSNPDDPSVDAGAYDPRRDRWRRLPRAPILGTGQATAVWTGEEMVVWTGSGNAGAAYDPCRDRWRGIAPSPLEPRFGATAVWTGEEMIVYGGTRGSNLPFVDGAAYDPGRNTWRALTRPRLPRLYRHVSVWTGREMLVWGPVLEVLGTKTALAAYQPRSDRWRALPAAPLLPPPECECNGGQTGIQAGSMLIIWSGSLDSAGPLALTFAPRPDEWTRLPVAPSGAEERFGRFYPAMAWTGNEVVLVGAGPSGEGLALVLRQ
jgi:hypothetical protein